MIKVSISFYVTNLLFNLTDVPPLEDCSEFFTVSSSTPVRGHNQASTIHKPIPVEQNEGFAGMKKGFLNIKGKTSKKKALDDIPFIKPSKSANTPNLQIPEVQEVLKTPLLSSNGRAQLCCILL